ncbi:MAG TPA: SpoIIE family protein phosphatase, partial [Acidimicrobiia bacterium]|nr:SpoIIE family protein phosphatase [Acidimicrobiia bacterium]
DLTDRVKPVAEAMAECDWTATAVGPPDSWPAALKTQVRILLGSRFSMWMGWGPELTFFYNDAYARDTLRVKHPWALGRPAREVWAEIWPDIGPRITQVVTTGEATWDEDLRLFLERSGYPEETYHTFSYSPMADDGGDVLGLLCVVSEGTDRVIGERRTTMLRDLAAGLAAVTTEAEVMACAEQRFEADRHDLVFTLIYRYDDLGTARLAAAAGIPPGHPAAPLAVDPDGPAPWAVPAGREMTLTGDFAGLGDLPTGAWDRAPRQAVVVPLALPGSSDPVGFLVAGLNPYRPFDEAYRGFISLVAGQLSAGIAAAGAFELERQRAQVLAELDRAKTEFFSNVSHEFRTPLTLITGPVDDLLDEIAGPLSDEQRRQLEVVRRNAGRLRRLVNNMLDFARIEAGRLAPVPVPTDLGAFTRRLAESFAPAIARAGLTFEIDVPEGGPIVSVDRGMWEKVVLNLLSNALKFTLDGQIGLRVRADGDGVEIAVTDTGVGIAADEIPSLFTRFHRITGQAARSHEGSGIGLALVGELVALHGGTVSVTSEPGAGSTFTVRLPAGGSAAGDGAAAGPAAAESSWESAVPAHVDEAGQWVPDVDGATAAADGGVGTVLVVDDSADLRHYIAGILRPFWRVVVAPDGATALTRAREIRPDLVLSDVMMPGLNGFELLKALRADEALAAVPVILLSARAGEEASVEGLEAGADDYLVKPFSSAELLARVRTHLEKAEILAESRMVATALQHALLGPTAVPPGVAVRYSPAEAPLEVGGDWYDALVLSDGRIGLVVGDCVGRGLRAATIMGQLRSACRALLLRSESPGETLAGLARFAEEADGAQCTTVVCAVVDAAAGTVTYSCAGHLPPVIVDAGGAHRLLEDGRSTPLGVAPGCDRPEATIPLSPGATLVLYTDGLVERRREHLDLGLERLCDAIAERCGAGPDEMADHLMDRLVPTGQSDDVALVVYRRT